MSLRNAGLYISYSWKLARRDVPTGQQSGARRGWIPEWFSTTPTHRGLPKLLESPLEGPSAPTVPPSIKEKVLGGADGKYQPGENANHKRTWPLSRYVQRGAGFLSVHRRITSILPTTKLRFNCALANWRYILNPKITWVNRTVVQINNQETPLQESVHFNLLTTPRQPCKQLDALVSPTLSVRW